MAAVEQIRILTRWIRAVDFVFADPTVTDAVAYLLLRNAQIVTLVTTLELVGTTLEGCTLISAQSNGFIFVSWTVVVFIADHGFPDALRHSGSARPAEKEIVDTHRVIDAGGFVVS